MRTRKLPIAVGESNSMRRSDWPKPGRSIATRWKTSARRSHTLRKATRLSGQGQVKDYGLPVILSRLRVADLEAICHAKRCLHRRHRRRSFLGVNAHVDFGHADGVIFDV